MLFQRRSFLEYCLGVFSAEKKASELIAKLSGGIDVSRVSSRGFFRYSLCDFNRIDCVFRGNVRRFVADDAFYEMFVDLSVSPDSCPFDIQVPFLRLIFRAIE